MRDAHGHASCRAVSGRHISCTTKTRKVAEVVPVSFSPMSRDPQLEKAALACCLGVISFEVITMQSKQNRSTYRRINRTKLSEAAGNARQAKLGLGVQLSESLKKTVLRMAIREFAYFIYRDYISDILNHVIGFFTDS